MQGASKGLPLVGSPGKKIFPMPRRDSLLYAVKIDLTEIVSDTVYIYVSRTGQ